MDEYDTRREAERIFKPLDNILEKLIGPTGALSQMQQDVASIRTTQEHMGREVGDIKTDVRALKEEVSAQPSRWRHDIGEALQSYREFQREKDEITGVVDVAKARMQAKKDGKSTGTSSLLNPGVIKQLIIWILLGLAAIGAGVSALNRGDADLREAMKNIEQKVETHLVEGTSNATQDLD